jgi:hypothetical protein
MGGVEAVPVIVRGTVLEAESARRVRTWMEVVVKMGCRSDARADFWRRDGRFD